MHGAHVSYTPTDCIEQANSDKTCSSVDGMICKIDYDLDTNSAWSGLMMHPSLSKVCRTLTLSATSSKFCIWKSKRILYIAHLSKLKSHPYYMPTELRRVVAAV